MMYTFSNTCPYLINLIYKSKVDSILITNKKKQIKIEKQFNKSTEKKVKTFIKSHHTFQYKTSHLTNSGT